jgi:type IV pilus assembly protein PilA
VASDGRDRSSDGFTLIELLVVIMIVGILATIALSVFLNQREKGFDVAVVSDLRNAATTQESHLAGSPTGDYASDLVQLTSAGFRPSPEGNYYDGTFAMTVSTVGGERFCITARSASGKHFGYSSDFGPRSKPTTIDPSTCF